MNASPIPFPRIPSIPRENKTKPRKRNRPVLFTSFPDGFSSSLLCMNRMH
ncbi:hypothetical protein BIFPSEUDO_04185 [Bifidobacterium pseudocatenulatum DSM 20438 = JCM 1200 = LMG 10505]|uniref:Uncharacterized protein n=1 Tax=Bifidobacterium pseudocatenulatum DSM 20438 = JCM 1200 = LMG 10505 TaxID=547043 RepID=C0BUU6_BIFPS|nr:hypothetical protein BIFPSEUDO_04185 [Bifidobacterium pseudocatenulatum DSM 20438 = JCM 1200 = LMG 10505]